MGKDVKNPNSIDIVDDLLEEIFLRLPLKSILKSKTVSKRWRSIIESKNFVERRMSLQKSRKIIAAFHCDCREQPRLLPESRFQGDEEIVYLHCYAARPSMTCDGLVCIPEQYGVNVLNPWTRQLRRFSYGNEQCWSDFSLGFGRDKVTGSYKLVKMEEIRVYDRDPVVVCNVLHVDVGEWWWMLCPSPYKIAAGSKSVCVNGSIYWLHDVGNGYKILALDLHKEEFHIVSEVPVERVTQETQISNLEDRLAIAITYTHPQWKLDIWSKDKEQERWSKTYSISLAGKGVPEDTRRRLFTPVAVSKQGILIFYDNHKRLFKYYPRTDKILCLSSDTCVISLFLENLAPLPLTSTIPFPQPRRTSKSRSRCRLFSKTNAILDLLIFTSLVVIGTLSITFELI